MSQLNLDLYEKVIIYNCLKTGNEEYLASVVDYLEPDLFTNVDAAIVVQLIKEFYLANNQIPNRTEIAAKITNKTIQDSFKRLITEFKSLDKQYSLSELVRNTETFIKQRSLLKNIETSLEEYSANKQIDEERALKEFDKIQAVSLVENLGMDFFEDTPEFIKKLSQSELYISTGYTWLDRELGGGLFKEGKSIYGIAGETNVGKAQPTSLVIRTPDGSKRFGDLKVGDVVFGKDGNPINITHIHPQGIKKIFKVKFMDGRETLCCKEHLWTVWNSSKSKYVTLTTEEIKYKIENYSTYKNRLQVPLCGSVNFVESKNHFIDPYVMGCLLGDGGLTVRNSYTFTNFDEECLYKFNNLLPKNIKLSGSRDTSLTRIIKKGVNSINDEIKRLGLSGCSSETKFIPEEYVYSSVDNRFKLLEGLIDTDGHVTTTGSLEILLKNKKMIEQISYIVYSLGGNAKITPKIKKYKGENRQYFSVRIRFPFNLRKKLNLINRKQNRLLQFGENKKSKIHNSILSIEEYSEEEAMCITVDAKDSLYLTNDFIVTHNSIVLGNIATNVLLQNYNVAIITLEMSEFRYAKRLASMLSGITQADLSLKTGEYSEFVVKHTKDNNARMFIKEFPTKQVSPKHVAGYLKKLERKRGFIPNLIVLDYHTLLKPSIAQGSKHADMQFVTQESRALSYIFECPVITAAQLNRSDGTITGPDLNRIAGSWDMLSDLDYLVNIWQTDEDREAELIRWMIKKARDSERNNQHFWNIDYSTLRLLDEESFDINVNVEKEQNIILNIMDDLGF